MMPTLPRYKLELIVYQQVRINVENVVFSKTLLLNFYLPYKFSLAKMKKTSYKTS